LSDFSNCVLLAICVIFVQGLWRDCVHFVAIPCFRLFNVFEVTMTLEPRDFMLMAYVCVASSILYGDCWSNSLTLSENIVPVESDWNEPSCPLNCTCQPNLKGPVLKVDCTYRTNDNSSLLADEIDRLLAPLSLKLTDLEISHSCLTRVPTSVCQLKQLSKLFLDNNNIATLPEQCFTKMVNLIEFSAENNILSEVQVRY